MEKKPGIFLSYSSINKISADKIDKTFSAIGIAMIRDKRDLAYRGNIEDFMVEAVKKADYVMMLISDEYLRSEYCIFEAGEALQLEEFEKKVLPVTLGDVNFFSTANRKEYYAYWDNKIDMAVKDFESYKTPDFLAQQATYRKAREIIALLFTKLNELKLDSLINLESVNYKPLFELTGIDEDGLLQKCIHIIDIKEEEEQLIALDDLQNEYKNNQEVDFLKALIYLERKKFKAARKFNEDYIKKYDYDIHTVYYNLGYLLESEFKEYENAKKYYEKAINVKPDYALAHNSLAVLLIKQFGDMENARKHFENAISSEENFSDGYKNLGKLLNEYYNDYEGAVDNYMHYLQLNAGDFDTSMRVALLAQEKTGDYYVAAQCYLNAINVDETAFIAHYQFARLLHVHIMHYEFAREQYGISIAINPQFSPAYTNLAILLVSIFNETAEAKKNFEKALEIEPDNDYANFNYAILLKDYLDDPVNGCKYYQKAIAKNPGQRSEEFDKLCLSIK